MKERACSIRPDELVVGVVYFMVAYVDENMTAPVVDPIVYLGRDIYGEGDEQLYFQDAASYLNQGRFDVATGGEVEIFNYPDNGLGGVLILEETIGELQRCSERSKG